MLTLSKNNLAICVGVIKKVPDISVTLSIEFENISNSSLNQLGNNCTDCKLDSGVAEACLAFALFEQIRDKFVGSALELSKSRVSNIKCTSIDNYLVISWNCQGTGSSLRKTLSLAMATLNISKLFSKFSENMRFLSGKNADRDSFNFYANKMIKSINKNIHITAVGKISIDKEKLENIFASVSSKFTKLETLPSGKNNIHYEVEENHNAYPKIESHGLASAALADYIRSNSNGMNVQVVNHGVIIYNNLWESKRKHLKDSRRIKDYVIKKYNKLGHEFYLIFAYFISVQNYANSNTIEKVLKSKVKPNELVELISKNIK